MNSRIRMVRDDAGLSQTAFGARMKLSRDTINNLEHDRNKGGVPDYVIKLICSEFNVDENWLRTGEGEMHNPTPTTTLDKLCEEYNCDDIDRNLLKEYLALNPEQRSVLKEYVRRVFEGGQTAEKTADS